MIIVNGHGQIVPRQLIMYIDFEQLLNYDFGIIVSKRGKAAKSLKNEFVIF